MKIWCAPYELKPIARVSRLTSSEPRHGALLKIERGPQGAEGYADLHPWPELGDLMLDEQLKCLTDGMITPQVARSLAHARLDAEARGIGVSAFMGLEIPKSHFLVSDFANSTNDDFARAKAAGFEVAKLKLGRDLATEAAKLNSLASDLSGLRLRFDFNAGAKLAWLREFLKALTPAVREQIEFLEDPMEWSAREWAQLQSEFDLGLALDRDGEVFAGEAVGLIDWLIAKPAVQELSRMIDLSVHVGAKLCVTSYLDHPVGQMGSALEAARMGCKEVCGLLSQRAFEPNAFSEALLIDGPRLQASGDAGIGFSALLANQAWKEVKVKPGLLT